MVKVQRMEKVTQNIYVFGDLTSVTKNAWKCLECSRVWFTRIDANRCVHQDYYTKCYNTKTVRISCIRLEPILEVN